MRSFIALSRRELALYFVGPTAYIILTVMLVVLGLSFFAQLEAHVAMKVPISYVATLEVMMWVIILVCPLITMRLLA